MVNGKPVFYEPQEVKAARQKLRDYLGQYTPEKEFKGPVRLTTWWCFPVSGKHHHGEYRTSKPDTDNLVKMLKDVMTDILRPIGTLLWKKKLHGRFEMEELEEVLSGSRGERPVAVLYLDAKVAEELMNQAADRPQKR